MRFGEIEALIGKTTHNKNTGMAARYLERKKLALVTAKSDTNIRVELDRRHPLHSEIKSLGRALYDVYLKDHIVKEPVRGHGSRWKIWPHRYKKKELPSYPWDEIDRHVLGDDDMVRALHLVAEGVSVPGFAIIKALGTSRGLEKRLHQLCDLGILKRRAHGNTWFYRLDRSWPAHFKLWRILRKCNQHIPDYPTFAKVHKRRRIQGRYTFKYRLRLGKLRKRASVRTTRRKPIK
jgi:hypothetical protein